MYNREEVQIAIERRTAAMLAAKSEERYRVMCDRRQQLGGMLELARRLNDHRLVRFLESHKDALTRMIEAE